MHTFEVWAPHASTVQLDVNGHLHPMDRDDNDWWRVTVDTPLHARYGFALNDDPTILPDPRSPRQPDGAHGRSELHDLDVSVWTDQHWTGRILTGSVIYQLDIAALTPEGTFDAAIERLDHLVALGVGHVELAVSPEESLLNWYAVHEPFGGPDGLQRFVDACHARGLAVIVDSAYHRLGASGAYLNRFGPYVRPHTANLDGGHSREVRRYLLANALRWFTEFHVDGLQLDAVHTIEDESGVHLFEELSCATRFASAHLGRPLTLIAQSELSDPRLITPLIGGGYGFDAQYAGDIQHAIHTAIVGEHQGFKGDFGSVKALAETYRSGFFYAGAHSVDGGHLPYSADLRHTAADQLIAYTRAPTTIGDPTTQQEPPLTFGQLAVAAALVLLSPYTPRLFLGEERGAASPLPHLTWDDPLTRKPDRLQECYQSLARLRRARPEITDPWLTQLAIDYDEDDRWIVIHRGQLRLSCNLGPDPVTIPAGGIPLLWWDEAAPDETGSAIVVPGHSFVVTDADQVR